MTCVIDQKRKWLPRSLSLPHSPQPALLTPQAKEGMRRSMIQRLLSPDSPVLSKPKPRKTKTKDSFECKPQPCPQCTRVEGVISLSYLPLRANSCSLTFPASHCRSTSPSRYSRLPFGVGFFSSLHNSSYLSITLWIVYSLIVKSKCVSFSLYSSQSRCWLRAFPLAIQLE